MKEHAAHSDGDDALPNDQAPQRHPPQATVPTENGSVQNGSSQNGSEHSTAAPPRAQRASPPRPQSTAVVHDWLPVYAGAERVLEEILAVLGEDPALYSLIDFLPEDQRDFLGGKPVETSFIQRLPFARSKYRYYVPLAPMAIEQFDLSDHDVVISSSYAVAKGALTTADQLHICYMHTPMRYAWDLHAQYLRRDEKKGRGVRGFFARMFLHYIRLFDVSSANRVDTFVANSQTVARRIWNTYRREAEVIYPPVDTEAFTLHRQKKDFFVTLSRLVPYKRIDLIVEAFSEMPGKELFVIGDGPEFDELEAQAGPNVTMLGYQPQEAVRHYLQRAQAFVFAAEEDFGIVPVEAQACGTPVIAYGRGGATETVRPGETGVLFPEQSAESLRQAVRAFEASTFAPEHIRRHAEGFSKERFREEMDALIDREYEAFVQRARNGRARNGAAPTPADS
jgi:glycosyltransferase involved in cell wall biosynthesis